MRNNLMMCALSSLLMITLSGALGGCVKDYLVFTTGTKFGVDISQQADQPPTMLIGYKRSEIASIPAKKENATEEEDTYSVVGNFCVMVDPQLFATSQTRDSLQIRSIFSTGLAARDIAANPAMQVFFARRAFGLGLRDPGSDKKGKTDKKCF